MTVVWEHRFEEIPNLVLFGYRFAGEGADEASKEVFDRALRAVDRVRHCSVWRTRTEGTDEWFVVAIDQSEGERLRGEVDWSPGAPWRVPADICEALVLRRLRTSANAYVRTGKLKTRQQVHYGLGAELRPDGSMVARVAGEDG